MFMCCHATGDIAWMKAMALRSPAANDGYKQLLCWAQTFGLLRRAGVEGTGSYGAALKHELQTSGAGQPANRAAFAGKAMDCPL